jgi:hypothetical protein
MPNRRGTRFVWLNRYIISVSTFEPRSKETSHPKLLPTTLPTTTVVSMVAWKRVPRHRNPKAVRFHTLRVAAIPVRQGDIPLSSYSVFIVHMLLPRSCGGGSGAGISGPIGPGVCGILDANFGESLS